MDVAALANFRCSFFLPVIFLLILANPTNAAVTQLGTPTFATNTNTHSFTVPAGTNRLLLVVASDDNALDVASVSFGASPMTQRAEHNDGFAVDSVWTLSLGTSASSTTATITVVSTGTTPNNLSFIAASAFEGVHQTIPISGVQMINNNTIPSASTLNITSATGNIVFDIFDVYNGTGTNTVMAGGSQTVIHNVGTLPLASGGFGYYRTSIRPGAATVPMSWSTTNGEQLIHIAFSIDGMVVAANASISGRVLTANGRGIRGANLKLIDSNGIVRQTLTSSFGYYNFPEVEVGNTYILQISSKGNNFVNPTRIINVNDNINDADFIAEPE